MSAFGLEPNNDLPVRSIILSKSSDPIEYAQMSKQVTRSWRVMIVQAPVITESGTPEKQRILPRQTYPFDTY